jgi:hypothetical protein
MPSNVEQAEHVLNNLRQKREVLVARGVELADERASIALAAHTGDSKASKRLLEINAALAVRTSEVESIDAAIKAAGEKCAAAEQAEARKVAAAKTEEARKLVAELSECFPYADRKLAEAATALLAIEKGFAQLRALGIGPTDAQVRLGVMRALETWAQQLPRSWHDQLRDGLKFLAPHERRDFSTYWKAVEASLQNAIKQHLGEQQPKQTEDAA